MHNWIPDRRYRFVREKMSGRIARLLAGDRDLAAPEFGTRDDFGGDSEPVQSRYGHWRMAFNEVDLTDVELPHTMNEFIRVSRNLNCSATMST